MEKHPIICPNCDNRNITIITEYHKSLACRIVEVILLALIFWIAIEEIKSFFQSATLNIGPVLALFVIALVCTVIIRHYIESKTHIQCVCKDCGWVWIHDSLY